MVERNPALGIIADTNYALHLLRGFLQGKGYYIAKCTNPSDLEALVELDIDLWMVCVEHEERWADFVIDLMSAVAAPVLVSDGHIPPVTDTSHLRWQKGILDKITSLVGDPKADEPATTSQATTSPPAMASPDHDSDEANEPPLVDESVSETSALEAPQLVEPDPPKAPPMLEMPPQDIIDIPTLVAQQVLAQPIEPAAEAIVAEETVPDILSTVRMQRPAEPVKLPSNLKEHPWQDQDYAQYIWVIGASMGGPEAVKRFFDVLPAGLPIAFVIAQHIDKGFSQTLKQIWSRNSAIKFIDPDEGNVLQHGQAVILPVEHVVRVTEQGMLTVTSDPWKEPYSPLIDQAMTDALVSLGERTGAILFSGMGSDGAIAGVDYKQANVPVWAQDAESCVCSILPDAARDAGCVEYSGAPSDLAAYLVRHLANLAITGPDFSASHRS